MSSDYPLVELVNLLRNIDERINNMSTLERAVHDEMTRCQAYTVGDKFKFDGQIMWPEPLIYL